MGKSENLNISSNFECLGSDALAEEITILASSLILIIQEMDSADGPSAENQGRALCKGEYR
jgi:hypothetical protein